MNYKFNIEVTKNEVHFNVEIYLPGQKASDSLIFNLDSRFIVDMIKSNDNELVFYQNLSENIIGYVIEDNSNLKNKVLNISYHYNLTDNYVELTPDVLWYPDFADEQISEISISLKTGTFDVVTSHSFSYEQTNKNIIHFNYLSSFDDLGILLLKNYRCKQIKYNENTILSVYYTSSSKKYVDRIKMNIENMVGIFMENFGTDYSSKQLNLILIPRHGEFIVLDGILGILPYMSFTPDYENWDKRTEYLHKIANFYSEFWLSDCPSSELEGFKNYFSTIYIMRFSGVEYPKKYYDLLRRELHRHENQNGLNLDLKIPLILNTVSHFAGYSSFKYVLKKIHDRNDIISIAKVIENLRTHFGIDYSWYIAQWYESNMLPDLYIGYSTSYKENYYKLNFHVEQNTSKPFKLPLEIELLFEDEKISKVLLVDKKEMNFDLDYEKKPIKVVVDPYDIFIGKVEVKDH